MTLFKPNQSLIDQFYDDIIIGQQEIFCDKWKDISNYIKKTGDFVKHIGLLNPKEFLVSIIKKCISNESKEIYTSIEKMQKAFYSLMLYTINIIRYSTKKEFQVIKRYTGYYKFNIDMVMDGLENDVFLKMGYTLDEKRDEFRFGLKNTSQTELAWLKNTSQTELAWLKNSQIELAWELYLSHVYCSIVYSMFELEFEKKISAYDAKNYFLSLYDIPKYTKEQTDFSRYDFKPKYQQYKEVKRYEEILPKSNTRSFDDQVNTRYTTSYEAELY